MSVDDDLLNHVLAAIDHALALGPIPNACGDNVLRALVSARELAEMCRQTADEYLDAYAGGLRQPWKFGGSDEAMEEFRSRFESYPQAPTLQYCEEAGLVQVTSALGALLDLISNILHAPHPRASEKIRIASSEVQVDDVLAQVGLQCDAIVSTLLHLRTSPGSEIERDE